MGVIKVIFQKLGKHFPFLRGNDDEDYEFLLVTPKDAVSRRNQSHQVTPVATYVFGIILEADIPTGPSEIFGMELEATEAIGPSEIFGTELEATGASCIYGTEIDEDASEQSADIIICEDEPNGNLLVFVEEEEPVQVNFLMCIDGD
jgi:hypothetical protein